MEKSMSLLLRGGVFLSGTALLISWIMQLTNYYHASFYTNLSIMALIAVPILRVVFAMGYYLKNKEFDFVAICGIVLVLIGIGFFSRLE